jgi:hypothetical protein
VRFRFAPIAVALLAAALLAPAPASSAASSPPGIVITGTVPAFASTGTTYAFVLMDPPTVAGKVVMSPLAGGPVTVTGGSFTVEVPQAAALLRLARPNGGVINLQVVTERGNELSLTGVPAVTAGASPAALDPAGRQALAALRRGVSETVTAAGMTAPEPIPGISAETSGPDTSCGWLQDGTKNNVSTRIGELHIAPPKTMDGTYSYTVRADSTFTYGINFDGGKWSGGHTNSVNNSLGAGGTDPHSGKTGIYIDAGFNYEYDTGYGCMAGHARAKADSSNADPFDAAGRKRPKGLPWASCHADPHGYVYVNRASASGKPGTWYADRSTAWTYTDSADVFGFKFADHTGYTADIDIEWENYGRSDTYVCGKDVPVWASPVFWNETY